MVAITDREGLALVLDRRVEMLVPECKGVVSPRSRAFGASVTDGGQHVGDNQPVDCGTIRVKGAENTTHGRTVTHPLVICCQISRPYPPHIGCTSIFAVGDDDVL